MIIMYSDYNPVHAGELLEADCLEMLMAALFLAGLTSEQVGEYNHLVDCSASVYEFQLGAPEQRTEQNYEDAVKAVEFYQEEMHMMLDLAGITIVNTLMKPPRKGHHHYIQTKVYDENEDYHLVACINRQITDLEAETYTNNVTGFAKGRDDSPAKAKP